MVYKIYEGLSDYLIASDGSVITKDKKKIVPFEKVRLLTTVRLITDEKFALIAGKKTPIRIVRRFTREQLVKMYEQSKTVFDEGTILSELSIVDEPKIFAQKVLF